MYERDRSRIAEAARLSIDERRMRGSLGTPWESRGNPDRRHAAEIPRGKAIFNLWMIFREPFGNPSPSRQSELMP